MRRDRIFDRCERDGARLQESGFHHVPGIAEILVLARLASTGANQELADRVVGLFEDDG
jgi:hypothetical protein